ncbi:uncharacterized protein LOC134811133 [Bolinopsis microptera]|uniref:uncharacterized protein LOC134811133 n=1 Tax=Bolinopsis microptera TaxID=2820187 RepID=UPI00307A2760
MKVLIVLCMVVLAAVFEEGEGACAWSDSDYPCDRISSCTYGCKQGLCWSQYGGACAFFENRKKCFDGLGCKNWCYLDKGGNYYPCLEHTDCKDIHKYPCKGACSW